MLTLEQAQKRVSKLIRELGSREVDEWVIVPEKTIQKEWGYVFFYQSSRYLDTGQISHALASNAPYIVNRHTGEVRVTGTTQPLEHYLREYEVKLNNGAL